MLLKIFLLIFSFVVLYGSTPIEVIKSVNNYRFEDGGKIRALYLNRYAAKAESSAFRRAVSIAKRTPVNAFVIDIKDVQGYLTYKSSIPEVVATGACRRSTIKNLKGYLSYLRKQGIYTIARIAVFKDNRQALKYPSRAIKTKGGSVWIERGGGRWIDPHSKAGKKYTLKIAQEVAKYGFDEINFDYIRFPARKGLSCKNSDTQSNRVRAIENFLSEADSSLRAYGVKISVDIFGYVLWNRNDLHIGQLLENISPYVDYICPMLYPSGYYKGTMGLKNPAANPYKIVKGSLEIAGNRVPHYKFRPWLQSFRDYAFDRRAYTHNAIAAQIKATRDYGTSGWMLWNPNSRYSYIDEKLFKMVNAYKYRGRINIKRTNRNKKINKVEHSHRHHRKIKYKEYIPLDNDSNSPLDILRN